VFIKGLTVFPHRFYSPQWLSEWGPGRSIWCFLHSAPSICTEKDRSNDKWTGTRGLWFNGYFRRHRSSWRKADRFPVL